MTQSSLLINKDHVDVTGFVSSPIYRPEMYSRPLADRKAIHFNIHCGSNENRTCSGNSTTPASNNISKRVHVTQPVESIMML